MICEIVENLGNYNLSLVCREWLFQNDRRCDVIPEYIKSAICVRDDLPIVKSFINSYNRHDPILIKAIKTIGIRSASKYYDSHLELRNIELNDTDPIYILNNNEEESNENEIIPEKQLLRFNYNEITTSFDKLLKTCK